MHSVASHDELGKLHVSLYHFVEWFMHISVMLNLRRKYPEMPDMFGAPVNDLTNRKCYLVAAAITLRWIRKVTITSRHVRLV
jgi:hypothetical protein